MKRSPENDMEDLLNWATQHPASKEDNDSSQENLELGQPAQYYMQPELSPALAVKSKVWSEIILDLGWFKPVLFLGGITLLLIFTIAKTVPPGGDGGAALLGMIVLYGAAWVMAAYFVLFFAAFIDSCLRRRRKNIELDQTK